MTEEKNMRSKQVVFNELYCKMEAGSPISVALQAEAESLGLQVDKIEDVVAASFQEEDYSDGEQV